MKNGIQVLNPIIPENMLFNNIILENLKKTAEMLEKRVGGGPFQVVVESFAELAETLINDESGFDSRNSKPWQGKENVLRLVFKEYGYSIFDQAIVMGVVRKYTIDKGFKPLAPGTIDGEAAFKPGEKLHRELEICGIPKNEDVLFTNAIKRKVGITGEWGNRGHSIEFVVFLNTPGLWTHIRDIEVTKDKQPMNRKTGAIIVTSSLTLYAECDENGKLTVNNLQPVPDKLLSVKTREAIKAMKEVYEECNMN